MIPSRAFLRLLAIALPVFVLLLLMACTPSHPQSTFDAVGPVADKQLTLFYIILVAAAVVFVPIMGILIYVVIRYRRKPGDETMPAQTHGNTRLEIAWTIAPVIVLAVIAVPTIFYIFDIAKTPKAEAVEVTFRDAPGEANLRSVLDELGYAKATIQSQGEKQFTIRKLSLDESAEGELRQTLEGKLAPIESFDVPNRPLEVNVTGHQWWWEFEYPRQNITTANQLHVPVDTPIKLNLRSDDVIHSFWIPKLAGKRDVIPTNVNPLRFTADSDKVGALPATIFGQCAEYCGVAHAHMGFRVIVESQEGFDAWVAAYHELATRPPPTGDTEEAKGFRVFQSQGCLLCHTTNGKTPEGTRQFLRSAFERGDNLFPAPNLTNFGTRSILAAGALENDPLGENLFRWLRDPDEVKRGNRMSQLANVYVDPEARLTDQEISALAAYLLSLK